MRAKVYDNLEDRLGYVFFFFFAEFCKFARKCARLDLPILNCARCVCIRTYIYIYIYHAVCAPYSYRGVYACARHIVQLSMHTPIAIGVCRVVYGYVHTLYL